MSAVSITAAAREPTAAMLDRITSAASIAGNYAVRMDGDDTILVERADTRWWLLGAFAPFAKGRHLVVIRERNGTITATGNSDGVMRAFLEAYLLDEERPAISPALRDLAAVNTS